MEKIMSIRTVNDLFTLDKPIKVPAYQRAYAWEEKQVTQFINDLVEFKHKGEGYYFGHFILEDDSKRSYLEIIDGQQRLTTFIIFLMVCKALEKETKIECYTSKFETVEYDSENLKRIQRLLIWENEWKLESFELNDKYQSTLSLQKIIDALNLFKKAFKNGVLFKDDIQTYERVITNAHASAHITEGKEVAVQIFELHNTRGIRLNTIEKVKAKLMKAVYKHNTTDSADGDINEIQNSFAEIFRLEELIASQSFRGELQLDELLLSHLRVIDDGTKIKAPSNDNTPFVNPNFNSPSRGGNREETILKYIDEKTKTKENWNSDQCIGYAKKLAQEFLISTGILCKKLPELDKTFTLIGDSLILETDLSTEFYLILFRLQNEFNNDEIFKLWEKLLYVRNYHEQYFGLPYSDRDDFQGLFLKLIKTSNREESIAVINLLKQYIKSGFRKDRLGGDLEDVAKRYIETNRNKILYNGYNWCNNKNVYALYKYEKNEGCNLTKLRKLMKSNRSIEHILPQQWDREWVVKDPENNIDEEKRQAEKINSYLDGIGNLLIVSSSVNSGLGNNHPVDKEYKGFIEGGSYTVHNENKEQWAKYDNWEKIINERGTRIYDFMIKYFFE